MRSRVCVNLSWLLAVVRCEITWSLALVTVVMTAVVVFVLCSKLVMFDLYAPA